MTHTPPDPSEPGTARETGALLLALGGLATAFGAASCCALPLFLGAIGIGTAWLGTIALLAGPYRLPLVLAALVSIGSGAGLLWRQRTLARACAGHAACGHPAVSLVATMVLSLGAVLAVLGYVFA
ncbi:MAG TPA: mercuric transporter MerT family protein [Stellaceae bacterium]